MPYKTEIFLIQTGLASLGFDFGPGAKYGPIDGLEGPKTRAAIGEFKTRMSSGSDVAAAMLKAALSQVGIRETSRNQGEGIAKYWTATTYPKGYVNREPYCAAFVCWAMREGMNEAGELPFSPLRSPVAYDSEKWAFAMEGKGVQLRDISKGVLPGDIFTLRAASHVGIVVADLGNGYAETVEANTNDAGSREGDGVYRKRRSISSFRNIVRIL